MPTVWTKYIIQVIFHNFKLYWIKYMSGGREVEFHEIKIGGQKILRSWEWQNFGFFMRSKFLIMIWSPDRPFFTRSKFANNALSFDFMNDLIVTSLIMRLKVAKNAFLNFDLMNDLLTEVGSWDQNYLNVLSCTCG